MFAPRAAELGFTTAHCFPLRLRDHVIGAMNIFRTDHRFLSEEERRVARALADVATIGLMQERALRRAEELTEQLQFALNSRIVIEQAKGAVARVARRGRGRGVHDPAARTRATTGCGSPPWLGTCSTTSRRWARSSRTAEVEPVGGRREAPVSRR